MTTKSKSPQNSSGNINDKLILAVFGVKNQKQAEEADTLVSGLNHDGHVYLVSDVSFTGMNKVIPVKPLLLGEHIEGSNGNYLGVVDFKNLQHLPNYIQSFKQKRTALDADILYLTDSRAKGQKFDFRRFWFNWATRVFTPVENKGTETGFALIKIKKARESGLLNEVELHPKINAYGFIQLATYHGINTSSIPLAKTKEKAFKPPVLAPIIEAVRGRLNWFLLHPFRNGVNWRNGNSKIYRFIFALLCLFTFFVYPILSFDYGTTWDEPEDRKYFKEVISYFQTGGEDERSLDESRKLHNHLVNYGPFVNLLTATVNEYISPFDIYETRHLIISLFAVIGLIFTALIARKLFNWRAAVFGFLLLMLTPTIFGHSFNNQKDIPFLAFYVVSIFYIIRFVEDLPKVRLKTMVMTALSMGILMSIRVGGLLVFAYLILFAGIKFLMTLKENKGKEGKHLINYLTPGILTLFFAYLIGVIFWPAAIQDPLNHPLEALQNFEKFSFVHIFEIFDGTRYYMKSFPWYYGPKFLLITVPLFVLAGLALFLVFFKSAWQNMRKNVIAIAAFTFAFPLAYIIYKESALYNGWRHLLFIYPSLVVLAAGGWEILIGLRQNKWVRMTGLVILAALMLNTTWWMIKNHPYQYVYYNELVGGVAGAYGSYETDYWCQSPGEAMKWLIENEHIDESFTYVISNNEPLSLQYYADKYQENGEELRALARLEEDLRDELDKIRYLKEKGKISDDVFQTEESHLKNEIDKIVEKTKEIRKIKVLWAREQEWNKSDWDYAIWTSRTLSPTQLKSGYFPPKGTIHTIEVDGVPLAAIVKRENYSIYRGREAHKQKKLDSAIYYYRDYLAYDSLEEEAYTQLAQVLYESQQPEEAKKMAERSIALRPENYWGYYTLGLVYFQQKNYALAEQAFRTAISYKDNFSSGYYGLAGIYQSQNNFQSALENYLMVLQYSGGNYQLYYQIGVCYLQLSSTNRQNLNEAANYFNAAIQSNPNFAQAYYAMSETYKAAGNQQKANDYLKQYLRLTGQ